MSTQHEHTDEQLQESLRVSLRDNYLYITDDPYDCLSQLPDEQLSRFARAFLAALPKPEAMTADEGALATSNPYVVSISTKDCDPMDAATAEALGAMVKAATAALPKAETQPTELDALRNTWGRVSAAVDAIDHKGDNTSIDDVLARLAVLKAPEGHETLPFFAAPHETEAIHELCKLQDMSQQAVLRQALRCYQQEVLRRHGIMADLPKPAEPDPYARLKAYNEARARIRYNDGVTQGDWRVNGRDLVFEWSQPPGHYEVHPDDLHLCPEYAPKAAPWTLPAPPPGRRWHREDWTQDMLPEGYRPLLDGEKVQIGDEVWLNKEDQWHASKAGSDMPRTEAHPRSRTRRPLPAEASAEPEKAKGIPLSEAMGMPPGSFHAHLIGTEEKERAEDREQQEPIKAVRAKADDGPAWIPHDGGPCPLNDEEVEEFEVLWSDGRTSRLNRPSTWHWNHRGGCGDILKYRVLKWKPGHGPQASTFTGHDGKTYNRHTPGNPCPVDKNVDIVILDRLQKVWTTKDCPDSWWTAEYSNPIIGWRYADEPAQEKAVCDRCGGTGWKYEDEVVGHLRCSAGCQIPAQPWTPAPGDVVRIKSGGPEMTVLSINGDTALVVFFYDVHDGIRRGDIPVLALTPAKDSSI